MEDAWAVGLAVKKAVEVVPWAPFGKDLLEAVQREVQVQLEPAALVHPTTAVLVLVEELAQ